MKLLSIMFLSVFWLNRTRQSVKAEACLVQTEQCDCQEGQTVICDQSSQDISVSIYLSQLDRFGDIKIENKQWSTLRLEAGFSFTKLPGLINLTLSSDLIQSVDQSFFSTGLDRLEKLDLNFNNLNRCVEINAPNLKLLWLMGNKLENVNENCFRDLVSLQVIKLDGNLIKQVYWNYLPSLKNLTLTYNYIGSINLTNMERLEYLDISSNYIWDSLYFESLRSLKYIDISLNALRKTLNLGELDNLDAIDLADQSIGIIEPEALILWPRINRINLRKNALKNITDNVFRYSSSLVSLDLSENQLSMIEDYGFVGLSNLTMLKLTSNQFQILSPIAFGPLIKLQELELSRNDFWVFEPKNFAHLSNSLQILSVAYNKLNYLKRDWLFGLNSLKTLNMSFNSISSIESGSFDHLVSLTYLDLSNNCFYKIDSEPFVKLSSLESLLLNDNLLADINPKAFTNQQKLINLNLGKNQIWTELSSILFQNLSRLEFLDLSNNNLFKIDSKQFEGSPRLRGLNMANNNLTTMNSSLDGLERLKELDLSGNKIKIESSNPLMISNSVMNNLSVLSLSYNEINLERLIEEYNFDQLESLYLAKVNLSLSIKAIGQLRIKSLKYLDVSSNHFGSLNIVGLINEKIRSLEKLLLSNVSALTSYLNFSNLIRLESLDLSYNQINEIRRWAFEANKYIKILNLSHNNISFIEKDSLTNLTQLKQLDLSFNRLINLIDAGIQIKKFPYLREFRVNHNSLSYSLFALAGSTQIISINFSNNQLRGFSLSLNVVYSQLSSLNLSFNLIESFDREAFKTGIAIKVLDLSHNLIKESPAITYLYILEKLYLNNNKITVLDQSSFSSLVCLKELHIQFNQIKILSYAIFMDLKELKIIDASSNNMVFIEDNTFTRANKLVSLNIAGNPDLEDFTYQTFNGLSSTRHITISRLNQNNFEIFKETFKPQFKKQALGISYYQSVDISYGDESTNLTESDCRYTLELIKVNLKLNLLSGEQFDRFIATCQAVFHSLLEDIY